MKFNDLVIKLENKENFSLIRWGDGELGWLFKDEFMVNLSIKRKDDVKENIYKVSDILNEQIDISKSFNNFYHAPQSMGVKMYQDKFNEKFKDFDTNTSALIIHNESINGNLIQFFNALKDREVIIVGREYLKLLGFKNHIITNESMVWNQREEINQKVNELITKDCVILYSCSAAANICIVDNFRYDITQIDTGSVFDPYCGHFTRRYHKTDEFKKVMTEAKKQLNIK